MQRRTKFRTKFYQDTFYQDTVYDSSPSRTLSAESGKCRYRLHCYLFISTECSYYFDWYVAGFYMINLPQSELKSRTVAIHGGISHNEAPSRALVGRTIINETSATKTSTVNIKINKSLYWVLLFDIVFFIYDFIKNPRIFIYCTCVQL